MLVVSRLLSAYDIILGFSVFMSLCISANNKKQIEKYAVHNVCKIFFYVYRWNQTNDQYISRLRMYVVLQVDP